MSNVLDHETQQQILGLGRVGWSVWWIPKATGVDRATVPSYVRAAGIAVRGRGRQAGEHGSRSARAAHASSTLWVLLMETPRDDAR